MPDNFYLAQALGTLATIILVISPQFSKRTHTLALQMFSGILWIVHYALFDAWSATYSLALGRLMIIAYYSPKYRQNKFFFGFFALGYLAILYFTYVDWTSMLATFAMLLFLFALTTSRDFHFRLYSFANTLAFFTLAVVIFSPVAIVSEFSYLASFAIAIYRFDYKKIKQSNAR